jgi:hypothetical protein
MAEPANPPGLTKPTMEDLEANAACRIPDLMHLLAKVHRAERSLTRPINGIEPSISDQRSAAALRRLTDAAVRDCASEIKCALVMHPGRKSQ